MHKTTQLQCHQLSCSSTQNTVNHHGLTADHGNESSHEAEIQQMIGINGRRRIDLQTVVAVVGVLEETVHWVEHFM